MPLVSVIIPNYNHAPYLKQRIDSVLEQTFQDFEVIILDDCSPDNSREIIEQYRHHPKVVHIEYNTTNSGSPFKQWKKGIDLAQGEYIWIAESDDWAEREFLEVLLPKFNEYENVGIVFCNSNWIDNHNIICKSLSIHNKSFFKIGKSELRENLVKYNTIQNVSSCIFVKKIMRDHIDGLEKFKACGDWLLYSRILQNNNLVFTEARLNYFRWYHFNTSNQSISNGITNEESLKILFKINLSNLELSYDDKKNIFKFWYHKIKLKGKIQTLKILSRLFIKLIYA